MTTACPRCITGHLIPDIEGQSCMACGNVVWFNPPLGIPAPRTKDVLQPKKPKQDFGPLFTRKPYKIRSSE